MYGAYDYICINAISIPGDRETFRASVLLTMPRGHVQYTYRMFTHEASYLYQITCRPGIQIITINADALNWFRIQHCRVGKRTQSPLRRGARTPTTICLGFAITMPKRFHLFDDLCSDCIELYLFLNSFPPFYTVVWMFNQGAHLSDKCGCTGSKLSVSMLLKYWRSILAAQLPNKICSLVFDGECAVAITIAGFSGA